MKYINVRGMHPARLASVKSINVRPLHSHRLSRGKLCRRSSDCTAAVDSLAFSPEWSGETGVASTFCCSIRPLAGDCLGGLVVKASASRGEDPGFESRLSRDFFAGSSHTSDFKIGTSVATLPGAWRDRVSAGTGWSGVSIL